MKKRLIIILVLLISIFVNINTHALDVTDNNNNTDIRGENGGGGSGGSSSITNGINGGEMQGIKVAVYRANGTMVPGTTPKYIIVRNGSYTTNNFCYCTNNTYDFTSTNNDGSCVCSRNNNITYQTIPGITGNTMYWGLYFSS